MNPRDGGKIVSRRHGENRVLADPDFDWLEEFFVFVCPVEWSWVSDQIVKRLGAHMKVLDVTATEAKASDNFRDISLALKGFESFQFFK